MIKSIKNVLREKYTQIDLTKAYLLFMVAILENIINVFIITSYIIINYIILVVIHSILFTIIVSSLLLLVRGRLKLASYLIIFSTYIILMLGFFNLRGIYSFILPLFIIVIAFGFYYLGVKQGIVITVLTLVLFIMDIIFNVSDMVNIEFDLSADSRKWLILFNFISSSILLSFFFIFSIRNHIRLYNEKQEQLQKTLENEQRYKAIVEDQLEIIFRYNKDRKITFINIAYRNYYGYFKNNLENLTYLSYIYQEDKKPLKTQINRLSSENPFVEMELRTVVPNKGIRWSRFIHRAIYDDKNEFLEYQAVGFDITERKVAQLKLKRSLQNLHEINIKLIQTNEELKQFTSVISHDLRSPLVTVISFIRIISIKYSDKFDDEGKELSGKVQIYTEKMLDMIDYLLNYTTMDKKERDFKYNDVNLILEEALLNLSEEIKKSQAIINNNLLPKIKCDKILLQSLFQNLIGNSIKYRKENEPLKISITAEKKDDFWKFCVKDNGIGIRKEDKEKIFDIFKRSETYKNNAEGFGIGLSFCKKIILIHQGKLWVESEPGKGSSFYFTLPQYIPNNKPSLNEHQV